MPNPWDNDPIVDDQKPWESDPIVDKAKPWESDPIVTAAVLPPSRASVLRRQMSDTPGQTEPRSTVQKSLYSYGASALTGTADILASAGRLADMHPLVPAGIGSRLGERAGRWLRERGEAAQVVADATPGNEFAAAVASGVGSIVPVVPASIVPGGGLVAGAMMQHGSTYRASKEYLLKLGVPEAEADDIANKVGLLSGAATGAATRYVPKALSKIPVVGKYLGDEGVEAWTKKVLSDNLKGEPGLREAAKRIAGSMGGESIEEGTDQVFQAAIAKKTNRPDMTWDQAIAEVAVAAAAGGITAGLLKGPMELARLPGQRQRNSDVTKRFLDAGYVLEDGVFVQNTKTGGTEFPTATEPAPVTEPTPPTYADKISSPVVVAGQEPPRPVPGVAGGVTGEVLPVARTPAPVTDQAVTAQAPPATKEAEAGEKKPETLKSSTQLTLKPVDSVPIIQFAAAIPDADIYSKSGPTGKEDFGRETEPHITALYGLTKHDAAPVEEAVAGHGPVTVTLGKISVFENEDYDVLKVDVKGDSLHGLNGKLVKLPNENKFPDYKPHLTIAYLKKGTGAKYAGDTTFEGKKMTFDTVTFSPPEELRASTGRPELPLAPAPVPEAPGAVPPPVVKEPLTTEPAAPPPKPTPGSRVRRTPLSAGELSGNVGARVATPEGTARVEAAKQRLRDIINNPDIVGKQRSDMLENGKELIAFLQAHSDTRKPMETGVFMGDAVAFTGEDAPAGFRSFIYLEGHKAGASGVAKVPTPEPVRAENAQTQPAPATEPVAKVGEPFKATPEFDAKIKSANEALVFNTEQISALTALHKEQWDAAYKAGQPAPPPLPDLPAMQQLLEREKSLKTLLESLPDQKLAAEQAEQAERDRVLAEAPVPLTASKDLVEIKAKDENGRDVTLKMKANEAAMMYRNRIKGLQMVLKCLTT